MSFTLILFINWCSSDFRLTRGSKPLQNEDILANPNLSISKIESLMLLLFCFAIQENVDVDKFLGCLEGGSEQLIA